MSQKPNNEEKKLEIINIYADIIKNGTIFPSRADLKENGVSRDTFRHHFGTIQKLRNEARAIRPEVFAGSIEIEDYVSDEYLNQVSSAIKKHKRFIVTTAVSGQSAHWGFVESMRNFCDKNDALLIILPSHDPAHNLDNEIDWHFDANVMENLLIFEETRINTNFFISGIRVTAKQINPITGLSEISQKKGSFISASPKQFLEYDPVSANKLPHARMTTGACTLPNYKSSKGNSLRTSYLAENQHTLGAVIVEIENDEIYHFRQVQADEKGSFCDLGKEYGPSTVKALVGKDAPVLVMGDYHAGEHDESAVKAWIEVINELKVQEVVFHDMFNGASINHHEEHDILLRAERIRKGLDSLEKELTLTAKEFDRILGLKSVKSGVVVKSNHDDFIDRWVRPYKFANDPRNAEFGTMLASEVIKASKRGMKPDFFKLALELNGPPKNMSKIRWLSADEDYVVGDVHLGAHGDRAANGSRGSIKGMAKAYPRCVIGHSHTPGIFKGAFQVGTTSLLRLGYNKGASSWVHSSCLVYKNGSRQLINSIGGKWRRRDNKKQR